jgi:hypothetical protein
VSAILEQHPCGCDHLKESCQKCWGLLSPTTEAALQGRINHLVGEGRHDHAAAAIDRRQEMRENYTKHFRPEYPGQVQR